MKIKDAISRIDSLKHNTYAQSDKVAWLSELDWMAKVEIIDTHEGGEGINFAGYSDATDTDTELLIPAPYDKAYLLWMEAQIAYYNEEYEKYNNAMSMFHVAYEGYKNYYNRTNMPKGRKFRFF